MEHDRFMQCRHSIKYLDHPTELLSARKNRESPLRQTAKVIFVLTILISTGCTSSQGFNRITMHEALHLDSHSTSETPPVLPGSTRPSPPVRLGIFFVKHQVPDTPSIRKVEWLSADRDQLLRELAPLRDEQLLADMFVLTDVRLRGNDIKEIRQTGVRFGADLVLIVDAVAAVDRYNNRFAWLYPTIIGAYLAPGTESDVLTMATGDLWAIHSDWHAPIQIVETRSKAVGAAAFLDDNAPLHDAKRLVIQTLGNHIAEQLRLLK